MRVKVLGEAGFKEALLGLSLSYNSYPSKRVADRLAHRGGGHSKFLESMQVWLDIDAPRYWWSQFDTYRIGTTKQSESTMHTLTKRPLLQSDFEGGILPATQRHLNLLIELGCIDEVKAALPESFLQRRVVNTNYMVLQNMIRQRKSHRLGEWKYFIAEVTSQCNYPEYLIKETDGNSEEE